MVTDLLLAAAFVAVVLAGFAWHRAFFLVRVAGPSMEPTLRAGDRLLVRRAGLVRRGCVCVVAEDDETLTVKRVAAVAGDPALGSVPGAGVVPAGCLVLLGDNRAHSYDSRSVGYYRTDRLLGVVSLAIRPVVAPSWRGRLLAWRRLPMTSCGSR